MNDISVIVPVYNTIEYLDKCIESILAQSYTEFELILVDDGSNDGCELKCDHYLSIDRRVRVIHQENKGLVYSRKIGCEEAKGDYIVFVDSDDWIESDYLEVLKNDMQEEVDLLVSNVVYEDEKKSMVIPGVIPSGEYGTIDIDEKLIPILIRDWKTGDPGIQPFIVGKMFHKNRLEQHLYSNDERITLGEDGAVSYPYIVSSKMIKILDYTGYHWVIHHDSMSHGHSIDVFERIKNLNSYMRRWVSGTKKESQLLPQVDSWIAKDFLLPAIKSVYKIEIGSILCIPPYELIEKGERIIIYGAGNCGKSFVRALQRSQYAQIVGWVDENVDKTIYGIRIQKPSALCTMNYDKIIVAVRDKNLYESIKSALIELYVEESAIVWKEYDWG